MIITLRLETDLLLKCGECNFTNELNIKVPAKVQFIFTGKRGRHTLSGSDCPDDGAGMHEKEFNSFARADRGSPARKREGLCLAM